jgi:hypothetical protein
MDDPRPLPRIAQRNIDDVYEQEPIRIRAFVKRGLELSDNGSPSDFISYALCGRDEQKQQQATIDIHRNPDADPAALTTTRDYDSAIGVMAELDMDLPINVFPVSPPRKRLQNNVHLFIPIQRNEVNDSCVCITLTKEYLLQIQIRVPLHQIPNMLLAEFGTRGQIRLFFPGLHREDRQNSAMSDDELASIYEKGVRPAAANAHVDHVAEWPATYHSEVTRIRGYKYGTKLVSHWHVNMFAGELRKSLESEDNGVPWAHGFLFEVEIMGVKALHPHQANDQPQAELALEALMNGITTGAGRWYIDVGLEFAQAGSIIAWRTDSHFHILRHVLSENEQHARRLTRMGSSKYSRDPFMLLTDLSGCRITPGSRGGPHEVAYLQLYVTDKSQTFSRDPSKKCYALYVNGSAIIAEGNKGRVPSLLVQLDELYRDAARIADGSGRIEIRVPLQHASSALLGLPDDLLKQSLKNIKRDTWW